MVALTGIEPTNGQSSLVQFGLSCVVSVQFVSARSAKCRHGGLTSWGGHGAVVLRLAVYALGFIGSWEGGAPGLGVDLGQQAGAAQGTPPNSLP
jgi:hypothetical protein